MVRKILLADDHELFRRGLREAIRELAGDADIVEAGDFDGVEAALSRNPDIDLALLDLNMPGMEGFSGIRDLGETFPDVPIVIISANESRESVLEALECGAVGYIPKTSGTRLLLAALQLVLSGGVYVPVEVIGRLGAWNAGNSVDDGKRSDQATSPVKLTKRQREVLAFLMKGKSNKEIARALGLAEGTVKVHVSAVVKALGVVNRTRAAVIAERMGLASAEKG